ncbi:8-amino-7-oxononanoate synthase [Alkalihalobacterium elongatum]|uniref:8-amino-7-oxononanoate synthase n=1 Tax=Alkalihalobacterium elongatum TaxID=2675466 RepID=UPI001C1FBD87|nr:8-amino-7-oxononanoate synthase [Alkalihalobacterium elongatum]
MYGLSDELAILEKEHLKRTLKVTGVNQPVTTVNASPTLLFSSNNYLGLSTDEKVKQAAVEMIEKFGTGAGGARLTTGNLEIHYQLEKEIAKWKKTDASLLFSSGYLANLGVLSGLIGKEDIIFSDELNHASIIDGCKLSRGKTVVYKHCSTKDLEEKLVTYGNYRRKLIVTDGVFSMDGNIAPLPEIVQLAEKYGAWVMVDDAHGSGVLGSSGAGVIELFNLQHKVQIQVGTLSKAFGSEGGFVAASNEVISYLVNKARPFIFQTALSPPVVGASLQALEIIRTEPDRRKRLLQLSRMLRDGLKKTGFTIIDGETPIVALLIGEPDLAVKFANELKNEGFFAPAIRPPTVPIGKSRIRFTVMATHTEKQIKLLIDTTERIGMDLGII